MGDGTFNQDLLSTIRESIQMHRRLIWIFAGSHHITELKHAHWDSYLVSVRTIEVPPFSEAETRLLLTEPLKESPLFRDDDARRPRFDAAFWGERGIEWIHQNRRLAAPSPTRSPESRSIWSTRRTFVTRPRHAGTCGRSIDRRWRTVLRQLMRGKSELPGEWDYLARFRTRDEQPPPQDEAIFQSLRHRQLIAEEGGMWRLRVPLMQRWLRERG